MVRITVLVWLTLLGVGLWGQEHQRVGASTPKTHRFEVGVEGSFCPFGYGLWDLSLGPRVGYEFQKTLSVSVSANHSWQSDPDLRVVLGTWGVGTLGFTWSAGSSDFRWRVGVEGSMPLEPTEGGSGRSYTLDLGAHWVRDPVIQGLALGISLPEKETILSGQGTWFFQEVVNDNLTWSLILSPRWTWYEGLPLWSLTVAWKVGWYDGPASVSSGISTGSGAAWTWSGSGNRSWELP